MEFILGCNYWASNSAIEMWRNWDEVAIRDDFKILTAHGIKYLRVFPNWRDFQPVISVYGGGGCFSEYAFENDLPIDNPYMLDNTMMERFSRFCDICEEFGLKLIVGLITGWMSGRLFIPAALNPKTLYTDSKALMLQQYFIKGFVSAFKDRDAIYAWDLGNECNCMSSLNCREDAVAWTAMIANAIRSNDSSRKIVSGMHGIGIRNRSNQWTIEDQAEYCDILTTHPYPMWVTHAYKDKTISFRTLIHATCETKYYSDIGQQPCLVEEIGTMGPMICSDEKAADFMRVNFFSNWANKASGVMWWCANEQVEIKTIPHSRSAIERELGMIYSDRTPKPVLKEYKRFSDILSGFDFELPPPKTDAVCVMTQGQDHWGVAYMTYGLAKQAGLEIKYCYCEDDIPESDTYLLPSTCGDWVIPLEKYDELRQRVYDGATLYVSINNAVFSEFEKLFGLKISDSERANDSLTVETDEYKFHFKRSLRYTTEATSAKILAYDSADIPAVFVNKYGKGKVYFVNFPLELQMLDENYAFNTERYKLYRSIFSDIINNHEVICENPFVGLTLHCSENEDIFCVAVNYSDEEQITDFKLADGFKLDNAYYGSIEKLPPCDACIFKIKKINKPGA